MADKLVRGNSMDGAIRVFAAVTTDLVNEAQRIHHTYPVATAALGRLLTGAAIMGAAGLKNETDSMTVQIKGEGEITNLVAVTDCHSRVRGYVSNPYVDRPLNNKGKLDVGGAAAKQTAQIRCRRSSRCRYDACHQRYGIERAVCRTNSACIGRNCGGLDILLCKK